LPLPLIKNFTFFSSFVETLFYTEEGSLESPAKRIKNRKEKNHEQGEKIKFRLTSKTEFALSFSDSKSTSRFCFVRMPKTQKIRLFVAECRKGKFSFQVA